MKVDGRELPGVGRLPCARPRQRSLRSAAAQSRRVCRDGARCYYILVVPGALFRPLGAPARGQPACKLLVSCGLCVQLSGCSTAGHWTWGFSCCSLKPEACALSESIMKVDGRDLPGVGRLPCARPRQRSLRSAAAQSRRVCGDGARAAAVFQWQLVRCFVLLEFQHGSSLLAGCLCRAGCVFSCQDVRQLGTGRGGSLAAA